jgi:hypothetical protein
MNRHYSTFLIIISLVLLVSGVYIYFSNSLNTEAAISSPLSSTADATTTASNPSNINERISADTAFLSTLNSLNKITIDNSLLSSASFLALHDNTVTIVNNGDVGRPNPFAPISGVSTNGPVSLVLTKDASSVTDKSAILNGSNEGLKGSVSNYFEYGTTPALGKTTAPVTQSLVGTFASKITGLTPKTTYFFRAVVKLNNTPTQGDVMSFTTN